MRQFFHVSRNDSVCQKQVELTGNANGARSHFDKAVRSIHRSQETFRRNPLEFGEISSWSKIHYTGLIGHLVDVLIAWRGCRSAQRFDQNVRLVYRRMARKVGKKVKLSSAIIRTAGWSSLSMKKTKTVGSSLRSSIGQCVERHVCRAESQFVLLNVCCWFY